MRGKSLVVVMLCFIAAHQPGTSGQVQPNREPASGLLLIASRGESKVDIVDEATSQTLASIPAGKDPHEIRVSGDGRTAYAVAGRTITVIDVAKRAAKTIFDLGEFSAHDVRISRDGTRLWAACAAQQTVL